MRSKRLANAIHNKARGTIKGKAIKDIILRAVLILASIGIEHENRIFQCTSYIGILF
jgi:hypothetical protein